MSEELSGQAKQYFESVRAILMRHWDPIGVQNAPEAYDEYDTYARVIVSMLLNGAYDEAAARAYLEHIAADWMGLKDLHCDVEVAVAAISALDARKRRIDEIFGRTERGDGSSSSP